MILILQLILILVLVDSFMLWCRSSEQGFRLICLAANIGVLACLSLMLTIEGTGRRYR